MFRRLLIDHWMSIFTLTAFITALSIYCTISIRALRMPKGQRDHLANLPLND
jgi:hypothetical protein